MTLWNIIRDWFVQYVWGGCASNGNYFSDNLFGDFYSISNQEGMAVNTSDLYIKFDAFNHISDADINYISIGDWLSTMSTILVLGALVLFLFFVVRYLFRLTSGLIRGR